MKEALKRLRVKAEQVAESPQITPLFQEAVGGLKAVLKAMRFGRQDEIISAFLDKYDSLPEAYRNKAPWEAVAIAAKVDIRHLTGSIIFALSSASVNAVKIIALTSHPIVMKRTAEYAQMASGEKDRRMIHEALGFLPTPKGPTFIGKAVFGGEGKMPGTKSEDDDNDSNIIDADDDYDSLFPSPTGIQDRLNPIRQRLLQG